MIRLPVVKDKTNSRKRRRGPEDEADEKQISSKRLAKGNQDTGAGEKETVTGMKEISMPSIVVEEEKPKSDDHKLDNVLTQLAALTVSVDNLNKRSSHNKILSTVSKSSERGNDSI